jgi:urea transporter
MGSVLVIAGGAFLVGFVLRRWYLPGLLAAVAALHGAWIVLTGQHTSEDSAAALLGLSAIFLYAPALAGVVVGVVLGRAVRRPRDTAISG